VDGLPWDFGVFSQRGRVSSADRIGHKMMEPSLQRQRRGTPKAWDSSFKKREGFSCWKGKSPRIAEWGGWVYVGISIGKLLALPLDLLVSWYKLKNYTLHSTV
jgi:hypothetical protein